MYSYKLLFLTNKITAVQPLIVIKQFGKETLAQYFSIVTGCIPNSPQFRNVDQVPNNRELTNENRAF
jgi:hypothetical protein